MIKISLLFWKQTNKQHVTTLGCMDFNTFTHSQLTMLQPWTNFFKLILFFLNYIHKVLINFPFILIKYTELPNGSTKISCLQVS